MLCRALPHVSGIWRRGPLPATGLGSFASYSLGYILLIVFQLTGNRSLKPKLHFKAGALWLIPWLILAGLQSWLMDPASHPDLFWWAFLSNAVITAVVFMLALKSRLPLETVPAIFLFRVDDP